MKNAIAYFVPRNNNISHSTSLDSKISCDVGISIVDFNKYWLKVFDLMEIKMIPTFEKIYNSKTINANKNKSYYLLQSD